MAPKRTRFSKSVTVYFKQQNTPTFVSLLPAFANKTKLKKRGIGQAVKLRHCLALAQ
jgi:hypothetical protein